MASGPPIHLDTGAMASASLLFLVSASPVSTLFSSPSQSPFCSALSPVSNRFPQTSSVPHFDPFTQSIDRYHLFSRRSLLFRNLHLVLLV